MLLQVSTNETAVTLMREEIEQLQHKLEDAQKEKETERSYFVSSLQEKEVLLEEADKKVLSVEAQLATANKALSKVGITFMGLSGEANDSGSNDAYMVDGDSCRISSHLLKLMQ